MVPLNGVLHRSEGLLTFLSSRSRVHVLVQLDARSIREQTKRLNEVEVLDLSNPRDLIARDTTTEAVVATFFCVHGERWRLLSVKGAETSPTLSRSFEGHRLANKGHDVSRRTHLRDLVL